MAIEKKRKGNLKQIMFIQKLSISAATPGYFKCFDK
jgi:hypothetical protein